MKQHVQAIDAQTGVEREYEIDVPDEIELQQEYAPE